MRKLLPFTLALSFFISLSIRAPSEAIANSAQNNSTDAAERLAQRALSTTAMIDDLQELCDRIGGRPTGSQTCERAIDWRAARFRAAGIQNVKVETYTVPSLWLPVAAEGACVSPEPFPIRVVATPYSPSTPQNRPLVARLVDAGDGTAQDFARLGARARGAIALVHAPEMKTLDDLFAEYFKNLPMLAAARKAHVAALLLQSSRPRGLLYRHPMSVVGKTIDIPVGLVSREHASRLARLAVRGNVTVRLNLINRIGSAYKARNVIAEIRGSERPDEIVLIGAHLDSWELGTGAQDNGVNSATVIDIARGIKQLGLTPRRTICFALFTGEEQGMFGSAGYVKSHAAELDRHVAMVTYDIGSGRTNGFFLNGREELRRVVEEAMGAVPSLRLTQNSIDGIDGTDNYDFLLSGVPNLVANQDGVPYLPDYHAESDVFDMVDQTEAKRNAAIASVLVWGLAERAERPAPRQTRAEVERLLRETHLDDQMKAFGQWDDWVKRRRGVNR